MKNISKYFLIGIFLVLSVEIKAQKARIVDLKVNILSPAKNSYIKSPGSVDLIFSLFNKGPDKIKLSDTLIYYPKSTDSLFKFQKIFPNKEILPGDSDVFIFNIPFDSKYDNNFYNLGILEMYAYNFSADSLRNETKAMFIDNGAFITVRHRSATSDIRSFSEDPKIVTFPSPADKLMTIQTKNGTRIIHLLIANAIGKIVCDLQMDTINSEFELLTEDLMNGFYYLTIITEQNKIRSKFIVQH